MFLFLKNNFQQLLHIIHIIIIYIFTEQLIALIREICFRIWKMQSWKIVFFQRNSHDCATLQFTTLFFQRWIFNLERKIQCVNYYPKLSGLLLPINKSRLPKNELLSTESLSCFHRQSQVISIFKCRGLSFVSFPFFFFSFVFLFAP